MSNWPSRSPEQQQVQQQQQLTPLTPSIPPTQEWASSPSPTSPASPYHHHQRINCANSSSLSPGSQPVYVNSTPEQTSSPCDQQQVQHQQTANWLHPTLSEQVQQQQQQQSYLNLNLHLHHQISYTVSILCVLMNYHLTIYNRL